MDKNLTRGWKDKEGQRKTGKIGLIDRKRRERQGSKRDLKKKRKKRMKYRFIEKKFFFIVNFFLKED